MTTINGKTPNRKKPRELYVTVPSTGRVFLSTEHPSGSGSGWAIWIEDPNELQKLRDALDAAASTASNE
ncbi:MAG TPA: hypothetical protein VK447_17860 [Myxococcaceae bacterium]|nr:hypothetical protein [Myxococcaceae bacterium]